MLKLLLELGPLLVFLITYKYSNIFVATIFIIATTAVCLLLSYFVDKKISIPLLISAGVLIFSGFVTVLTKDPKYIKMKPTIVYLVFGISLFIGAFYKKPLIKGLLEKMFAMELSYWIVLSMRFGYFFIVMAIINEFVWRNYSENFWVEFKIFGAIPLSIVFMLSQLPFLKRNGKILENIKDAEKK